MNSQLYGKQYKIPDKILQQIKTKLMVYNGGDGVKRANNLTKSGEITYQGLKRLKNFFDNVNPNEKKQEYELSGGDNMKRFVEATLNSERKRVEKSNNVKQDLKVNLSTDKTQNIGKNSIHENEQKDELTKNVSAIIFDKDMRILLLKRSNFEEQWQPNKWAVVGGGVEKGEDPEEAIKREIKEETGLEIDKFKEKFIIQRSSDAVEHIYITKYSGEPEDVDIDFEHNGFMWASYAEIKYLNTVPNLVDYINIAIQKYD